MSFAQLMLETGIYLNLAGSLSVAVGIIIYLIKS
jgi:hypothetical protein